MTETEGREDDVQDLFQLAFPMLNRKATIHTIKCFLGLLGSIFFAVLKMPKIDPLGALGDEMTSISKIL